MADELTRKLPFSLIAEQSLLGSVLIDPDSFNEIADIVLATDFYLTEHTQIYAAMQELFLRNREIDIVTLIDMLVQKGIYDKSGGENYIRQLAEAVPNALNVKDYARIVKDKSSLRQLIGACGEILEAAYSEQDEVAQIVGLAESKIFAIAQGRDSKNFVHIRDAMLNIFDRLHLLQEDKSALQGTKTGFSGLDAVLAGMGNSDLVLVGARPGMGKTSFALNIATNVAQATKKTVCIFSLEMSAEQLVTRVLSSEAMVDSYSLRTGEISNEAWDHLAEAASTLSSCEILIDDTTGITVTGMKAKLRRVENLGLVVIDYLQLMQADHRIDNRVQEVADISRNLKVMAKELNVPVICCAQLSRGPESRTDKKPMLSDLRDSGAIEQDADVVMFLYRDEYYKTDRDPNQQEANIAEVIVAKNRHGSTGNVEMGWIGKYTKFRTIVKDQDGNVQA
ncbi:MAG: replicative DNA helicase [Clostridia bacterium]|nr:replicative DNA helicase [Clostridia bacterium]